MKGKVKELFEEWYVNQFHDYKFYNPFNILPSSMQWGVMQDFYDSLGINIFITVEHDFGYIITKDRYDEIYEVKKWYNTRQEARQAALDKAEEIINNNKR